MTPASRIERAARRGCCTGAAPGGTDCAASPVDNAPPQPFRPPWFRLISRVPRDGAGGRIRRPRGGAADRTWMKLTIERAALLKALGHVQSVVERRNTIPILSNVLLSASQDRLTFSATDLDLEIIDEALAQVDQPGQITPPAHTLYEIVRNLPYG